MGSDAFLKEFSPELAAHYFDQIQSSGFCCVENAISQETLALFRREVRKLTVLNGRRFLFLVNPWKQEGSAFARLATSKNFNKFLVYLCGKSSPASVAGSELLNVLRVVPGDRSVGQALNFHYDAEVVTALVPIEIPTGAPEKAGHLVAMPNIRPIRKFVLLNVVEKALLQNPVSQKIVAWYALRGGRSNRIYKLVPGNIYFFWGYRTLHANLPVDADMARATMLFHFGDPHASSKITGLIKKRHRRIGDIKKPTKGA